jgi:hypothetical protein
MWSFPRLVQRTEAEISPRSMLQKQSASPGDRPEITQPVDDACVHVLRRVRTEMTQSRRP